jgi:hypothetical protein
MATSTTPLAFSHCLAMRRLCVRYEEGRLVYEAPPHLLAQHNAVKAHHLGV